MRTKVELFVDRVDCLRAYQSQMLDSEYPVKLWIGETTIHMQPDQAEKLHKQLGETLAALSVGAKS